MTGKDYFKIDDTSSAIVDLWIDTPPITESTVQSYDSYQSGDYGEDIIVPQEHYSDITVEFTGYTFVKNFSTTAMYKFLNDCRNKMLTTSLDSSFAYKIKHFLGAKPTYKGNGFYAWSISFLCSPFKYSTDNEFISVTTKTKIVSNDTNVKWQPIFKVDSDDYTAGCDYLQFVYGKPGNKSFKVYNPSDSICVHAERQIAFNASGVLLLADSEGDFPYIASGSNTISVFQVTGTTATAIPYQVKLNKRWI